RHDEILAAQLELLYANAGMGSAITILAATTLCGLEWGSVPHLAAIVWWAYMMVATALRYRLARQYGSARSAWDGIHWLNRFVAGAGMAGLGWGVAPLLLYPPSGLTYQVALVFIIGGMMLGASSLLAPRHEAFLAYLIPAGLGTSGRLLLQGDETHLVMGFLAAVFSVAIIA